MTLRLRTALCAPVPVLVLVLLTWAASAASAAAAPSKRTALILFMPASERQLASVEGLSVGIMSASQGQYRRLQLLLDLSQGTRISSSAYSTANPPTLSLTALRQGAVVEGWKGARKRADDAPQLLSPGLLASQVPGGSGYVGVVGGDDLDGLAAADRSGRIAQISLGTRSSLLDRIAALRRHKLLVLADLPSGAEGVADLRALSRERENGELLLVVQRVADDAGGELLWTAAAGLDGGGHDGRGDASRAQHELTSQSTNQRGLIASVDIAPTILAHLRAGAIPSEMRGKPIEADGQLHSASLRSLKTRLHVLAPRRLKALACLLAAWALLLLISAPWPRARGAAIRAGAIGVLWAPIAVLISAALEPSATVECLTIAFTCLALGALTDLFAPWPRAPLVPAIAAVAVLTIDALAHTQLLMRSLLGPNPIFGARFYGIGNELKSALAVLVLAAVAAALYPAVRGRKAVLAMSCAGIVLAVVEGSARIGAGVGGVILVSAGFAVAIVTLLPSATARKRSLLVLISPVVGLIALAGIDLASAHGSGHFTGSVLHARSASDIRDLLVRRYSAAWRELKNHTMPAATALALLFGALALRRRERLLAPVGADPAWLAALAGGLTAGVLGALVEDSGPVLLVVAVFVLGCLTSYLWAPPNRPLVMQGHSRGRAPADKAPDTSRRSCLAGTMSARR